jgi:hypothetical protein
MTDTLLKKRAISPLVATVLLIGISVAAASLIYLWLQGFILEQTAKNNAPLERSCENLIYSSEITDGGNLLLINNEGNVPIKEVYVKATNAAGSATYKKSPLKDSLLHVPAISPGRIVDLNISDIKSFGATKIEIIPVLYGTGKKSGQLKMGFCPDQKQEKEMEIIK